MRYVKYFPYMYILANMSSKIIQREEETNNKVVFYTVLQQACFSGGKQAYKITNLLHSIAVIVISHPTGLRH